MTKIDLQHQELIHSYLREQSFPLQFILNITWLAKGPYKFIEEDETLMIFKDSQMYGKPVQYMVSAPMVKNGDLNKVKEKLNKYLPKFRCALTNYELEMLGLDSSKFEKKYGEYLYHSKDYETLAGKDWASWRNAINKAKELFDISYYYTKFPFTLSNSLSKLITEWKEHRGKYIGKHVTWYADTFKELNFCMVQTFKDKQTGRVVCYTISQKIGDTVFFLDEKTTRHGIPNSLSISKAYHYLCISWWKEFTKSDFYFNSGLGEKPYEHNGKTFDLNQHKDILRPMEKPFIIHYIKQGDSI